MKIRQIIFIFSLFFCWASFYFYSPVMVQPQVFKIIYTVLLTVMLLVSWQAFFYRGRGTLYYNPMRCLLLAMLFSIIPALVVWRQSIALTLIALLPYLAYLLFFFLYIYRPDVKDLEKIIWILCIVYICLYLYALYMAPTIVFGAPYKRINDARGFFRLFVPGRGFLYLGFFLAISKYIEQKKTKWIVFSALLFLAIVLHVTRQYIFFSFVISFFFLLVNMKLWKRILFITITAVAMVYALQSIPILQKLSQLTEDQYTQNTHKENVRVTAYRQFLFKFSPNLFTIVFGNGTSNGISDYGKFEDNLKKKGSYMADVGYAQIYALFGIIGIASFIVICYRAFRQKVPDEYLYAKMYIIFVSFATLLSDYFMGIYMTIPSIAMALYVLERANRESKGSVTHDAQTHN